MSSYSIQSVYAVDGHLVNVVMKLVALVVEYVLQSHCRPKQPRLVEDITAVAVFGFRRCAMREIAKEACRVQLFSHEVWTKGEIFERFNTTWDNPHYGLTQQPKAQAEKGKLSLQLRLSPESFSY